MVSPTGRLVSCSGCAGGGFYVGLTLMIWAKNALEVLFFVGLMGCLTTVVWSWISVGRDALSSDDAEDIRAEATAPAAPR